MSCFHPAKPIMRSLAIVSLMSAALLTGPVMAQTSEQKPPAAAVASSSNADTVEERIASLKSALKILPDQEPKWAAVATAMRVNGAAMEKLIAARRSQPAAGRTALGDLETYQEFAQAHVDGLKNLIPAFKALYDSMSADQKINADQVFQSFRPHGSPG